MGFGSIRHALSVAASRLRADLVFAFIDVFVVVAAYTVGLALRMLDPGVDHPLVYWSTLFIALPVIVAVHIAANAMAGAYGHVWEHASTDEAIRVILATASASGVLILTSVIVRESGVVRIIPYATLVIGGLLTVGLMGLVRFRSRLFSYRKQEGNSRILVVGSGPEAATFARRASEIEGVGMVIGFVADNADNTAAMQNRRLAGLPVVGELSDIAQLVIEHDVDQVVVIGKDPVKSRRVVDLCIGTEVGLRILPVAGDVLTAGEGLTDIRDIRVEDLLAREPVATDLTAVRDMIRGKTVLVTGGGGSIGSEVVRQILEFEPSMVWVLDRDETLLHDARLRWEGPTKAILGDVRDAVGLLRTFSMIRPEVVFHAAALKHVPVLEEYPAEAVLTNVIGTRNVIEAGSRTGMKHFVLISTDKAVDPSSVMGASKMVAEMLVKAGTDRQDGCTYTAVRFGNVLGSRGSVIPTFISQVKAGGPVTVTHPEMTRYFMTVHEAVQLVLQASALAKGSEVFLLDMGEPVRIQDLARRLIRLGGLIPQVDIAITYTGIRPGEKLHESLATGPISATINPKVFEVPLSQPSTYFLFDTVADLEDACRSGDDARVLEMLNTLTSGRLNGHEPQSPIDDQLTSLWS